MFSRTSVVNKILKLKKFIRGIQGGTSSGKTYSVIAILIDKATKSAGLEISIVSESIPHLKRGAIKDFVKIMKDTGRWNEDGWNASSFKYTFINGSFIEFFSATDSSKLRGARRDWLYVNECNNINYEAFNELAARTKKGIYLDWNPVNEFWFHEHLLSDNNVDFITVTYEDNEACPESAKNFILQAKEKSVSSPYWENWYQVYGLGKLGTLYDSIFKFDIIEEIPNEAELLAYGLDWGFSVDPTALVAVYRYNGGLIIEELIYETNLTNSDIIKKMDGLKLDEYIEIIADSAEPKSIEDIYRGGYSNIYPAKKGQDSIRNSIDTLQSLPLSIVASSLNAIKEFRGYTWKKDKNGKLTNDPIDANNHIIDAVRYVALNKIGESTIEFI